MKIPMETSLPIGNTPSAVMIVYSEMRGDCLCACEHIIHPATHGSGRILMLKNRHLSNIPEARIAIDIETSDGPVQNEKLVKKKVSPS